MGTKLADVTLLGKDSIHPGIPNADVHGQLIEEQMALLFVPDRGWLIHPHSMLNSIRYQDGYTPLVIPWEHLRDYDGEYTSTSWTNWAYGIIKFRYYDPDYRREMSVMIKITPLYGLGAKDTTIQILRTITAAFGRWYRDLERATSPR